MNAKRNSERTRSKGIQPSSVKLDQSLEAATREARLILLRVFDEVMARTSDQIHARTADVAEIPLLFGRSGGFEKRMADVQAGKKETVNLPSHLKRFMKEHFPEYRFDTSDPEWIWFRKGVRPTLDLLLRFDKVHQWGLGKTFTLDFGVDFPGTPFRRMLKNIFWMFHESWEQKVWAYTTSNELETALRGCGDLLRRVLPVLEKHCCDLLQPQPVTLPPDIEQLGALSAREAYNIVQPMARKWAEDAEMESIGAAPITEGGRLRPEADWKVKFVSKRLDRYCWYVVPYTGRVWWDFHPVMQNAIPKYSSVFNSGDWIDSTAVAPRAFQVIEKQLGALHIGSVSLALCDPSRYSGNFVWRAVCTGESSSKRRDITVYLNCQTGAVLGEVN
jgi:hypothetical protein